MRRTLATMQDGELSGIGTWTYDIKTGDVFVDANLANIFGLPSDGDKHCLETYLGQIHPEDLARVQAQIAQVIDGRTEQYRAEYRLLRADGVRKVVARGYLETDAKGRPRRLPGVVVDVTDRRNAERALEAEKQVLESIAKGAPTLETLDVLARGIERQSSSGMLVSALILDENGQRLLHGAAPSLAPEYTAALNGVEIGPCVGSCGTAAFTGQAVLVADISTDPLWKDFKTLAAAHDLAACYSFPILSSSGGVLGTLAMYYRKPQEPSLSELKLMESGTYLAGIVLQRARSEAELRHRAEEFVTLANALPQLAWMADSDGHVSWYNDRWYEFTGMRREDIDGPGWQSVNHPDHLARVIERWSRSVATGTAFQMEIPLRGADGVFRTFLTRVEPVHEGGRVVRWFGTSTDVDELLKYREEREQLLAQAEAARREATELSRQLTQERDKLREANRQLTDYNTGLEDVSKKLRDEQEGRARLVYFLRSANRAAAQLSLADSPLRLTEILMNLLVTGFDASAVGIWHLTKDNSILESVGRHNLEAPTAMLSPSLDVRYNSYKPCWVARHKQPFAGATDKGDLQFDHDWLEKHDLAYAGIYPLTARDKVVGVLAFFAKSEQHVASPEVLATVAAVYGSQLNSLEERSERETT